MKQSTARWLTYNRLSLLAISNSKDVNIREHEDDRGLRSDLELDLDSATRKLTFLYDEFSITESISKTQLRFLDVIEDMLQVRTWETLPEHSAATDTLKDELRYLRESFKSAAQYIARDMHNIQGLVQTVRGFCVVYQATKAS
jgi:hypothetical protein